VRPLYSSLRLPETAPRQETHKRPQNQLFLHTLMAVFFWRNSRCPRKRLSAKVAVNDFGDRALLLSWLTTLDDFRNYLINAA
jgi:hypothetical protein